MIKLLFYLIPFLKTILSKPEQIHTALAGLDINGHSNQIRVNWYTKYNSQEYLEYGTSSNLLNKKISATKKQYLPYHGYHHTALTQPLVLNTTYYYHVGNNKEWSDLFSIKTPPVNLTQSFTVSMFGDMGWLGSKERPLFVKLPVFKKNWSAVPTQNRIFNLVTNKKIDLITMLGDISYADDSFAYYPFSFKYEYVYNGYMNWMQDIIAQVPFMTVPGNHESECHSPYCYFHSNISNKLANFTAYNSRFTMPSKESEGVESMWYSFNYGGIHFTMINTETDFPGAGEENHGDSGIWPAGHFASKGAYLKWLEKDLIKANQDRMKRPWIIATGHRPLFDLPEIFNKLFNKYNVDMYISGHVHEYIRYIPENKTNVKNFHNINETIKIVVGSAGCDEMEYITSYGKIIKRKHKKILNKYLKNKVKLPEKVIQSVSTGLLHYINQTTLHWQLIDSPSGKVLDEFFLSKDMYL